MNQIARWNLWSKLEEGFCKKGTHLTGQFKTGWSGERAYTRLMEEKIGRKWNVVKPLLEDVIQHSISWSLVIGPFSNIHCCSSGGQGTALHTSMTPTQIVTPVSFIHVTIAKPAIQNTEGESLVTQYSYPAKLQCNIHATLQNLDNKSLKKTYFLLPWLFKHWIALSTE